MGALQNLFGFKFKSNKPKTIRADDFIDKLADGDTLVVQASGGQLSVAANFSMVFQNEKQQIEAYRNIAENTYVDSAIDDIVNEAIDYNEFSDSQVKIDLEKTDFSPVIKSKITDEFNEVLRLLSYTKQSDDLFREWYVDGRHYFYLVVGSDPTQGIKKIRKLDSRYIKRIKKVSYDGARSFEDNIRLPRTEISYIFMIPDQQEHELSWMGAYRAQMLTTDAVEITDEAIAYSDIGLYDVYGRVISPLQRAIKSVNQLGMLEDSLVIYRVARAPERRAFYVDVGDLASNAVEQYMNTLIAKFKDKATYDPETGLMNENYAVRNMLEDIWLPRKEGKSTEVQNLQGGQNLGELQDVEYFRQKLYKALKIPVSRLAQESQFSLGRAAEISRDEVKFSKYIGRMLDRFSDIFKQILKRQLILKKILTPSEWIDNVDRIRLEFARNSFFEELKSLDMLQERINVLNSVDPLVGKYFSQDFAQRRVLRFSTEDIEREKSLMEQEKAELEGGDTETPVEDPSESAQDFSPSQDFSPDQEGSDEEAQDFSPSQDFSPDQEDSDEVVDDEAEDFSPEIPEIPDQSEESSEQQEDSDEEEQDFSPSRNFKPD